MSNRIIIFGTGKAGLNALQHFRHEAATIVAFCDNNPQKHGTRIDNVPVIAPRQLKESTYDRLVIASMFLNEIRTQLVNEIGIPPDRIEALPSYICLIGSSPDRDVEEQTLFQVVEIFDREKITYFLDSSALLSIVRSGDFLPWPHGGVDFSVCVPVHTGEEVLAVIQRHFPANRVSVQRIGFDFIAWKKGDIRGIKVVDQDNKSLFTASIRYHHANHVYWVFEPYVVRVPAEHILRLERMDFRGRMVNVPSRREEYLALVYGDDWRTPKKNWHWSDSKHIFKEVSHVEAQG
ncbi:MAG: hypothetical protein PCFJNLEI_01848 [Verrucomicrobiae bacterium]|nr:hypothetical protein [Verrucomicrobiae bacterium]